jgi:membrane protease YdiL (CAAX protease family)
LGYMIILLMLTLSLEMFLASANVEKIGDFICIPLYSIVVLIYLYLYCCKYPPVIAQNYWLRFKESVKLLRRKEFLYLCVSLLLLDGLIISIRISEPFTVNTIGKELGLSATYLQYPVTLFLLNIILPIREEILCRGFLFSYIRQFHRFFAYLLTTGFFYYMHDSRTNLIFYLGLYFAYSYEKCRTLAAPVLLHIQHNYTFVIFYLVVKYSL